MLPDRSNQTHTFVFGENLDRSFEMNSEDNPFIFNCSSSRTSKKRGMRSMEDSFDPSYPQQNSFIFTPSLSNSENTYHFNTVFNENSEMVSANEKGSAKKQKTLDDISIDELHQVSSRIICWLYDNSPTFSSSSHCSLPKTLDSLLSVVTRLSAITVHVDPLIIFYQLLFNNILEYDQTTSSVRPTNYILESTHIPSSFLCVVPQNNSKATPTCSPDFTTSLIKTIQWIRKTPLENFPKTLESLLKVLQQVTRFRRQVSPERVLEFLMKKSYIHFSSVAPQSNNTNILMSNDQKNFTSDYFCMNNIINRDISEKFFDNHLLYVNQTSIQSFQNNRNNNIFVYYYLPSHLHPRNITNQTSNQEPNYNSSTNCHFIPNLYSEY